MCESFHTIKKGYARSIQTYLCKDCGTRFSAQRREKTHLQKQLWTDYVFHKQTVRELSYTYKKDRRTIRHYLETYTPSNKIHDSRPVHIVVDGTYWGDRKEETNWCSVVARDPYTKEDLWWMFTKSETTTIYRIMRDELESFGYTIQSVTGDGFGGIRTAFSGIPFQMCHVHMERIIIKGTTRNPQLEAGTVLLALVRTLSETNSHTFHTRLTQYIEKYRDFLNEKTVNPLTGESCWTHRELRSSMFSLVRLQKYLFTYEDDKMISKTTNSIEGHFSHIDDVVGVHRGLSRDQKEKVLHTLFLLGTIAPDEKEVWNLL